MEFWKEIEEHLWDEGFDVLNENGTIQWRVEKGSHSIEYQNIAIDGNKLAWYQDEEVGKSWVKIRHSNGMILSWKPISNHSDYGFRFHYIKWFGNQLVIIYGEKHREYIVKFEDLTVTVLFTGNISNLQISDEKIYVKNYKDIIQVINLSSINLTIYTITENDLKNYPIEVELKPKTDFFVRLDPNYNKNYS